MDTARIRRAFKYPEAEDREPADSSSEEFLDEQGEHAMIEDVVGPHSQQAPEQEELIDSIAQKDAMNTVVYKYVFSALPVLCALTYLPIIFGRGSTVSTICDACFCIVNLSCSAWIMFSTAASDHGQGLGWQNERRPTDRPSDFSLLSKDNFWRTTGTLGFMHAFQSLVSRRSEGLWPPGWFPFVIFGLIMLAKQWMTPIDVEELEKSRYRYKGA